MIPVLQYTRLKSISTTENIIDKVMRAFFAADARVSQLEAAAEVGVFYVGSPVCLNSADAACLPIVEPAAQTRGVPGWGISGCIPPPRNF